MLIQVKKEAPVSPRISSHNKDDVAVVHSKPRQEDCEFRRYPPHRYYGLTTKKDSLPDFLNAEYIYGELPIMIQPKSTKETQKLCVDQSEWHPPEDETPGRLPFADGTNPSILKLKDNPRIDASIRQLFPPHAQYLTTICMTNSQCAWNDTPEQQQDYQLSAQTNPVTVRTVLLVLNKHFETMAEATIFTVMDGPFGKRQRAQLDKLTGKPYKATLALDDARLFTYQGQIWVSYREGKLFGFDKQVLNKLHLDVSASSKSSLDLSVQLLASDTETLCCGRNMALIDNINTNQLQALTWVDPVTVVEVEMVNDDANKQTPQQDQMRRRLAGRNKRKESHFHGTNGFMVYLPHTREYLGIGHFHRPPGREKNDYARFGHHYTHAFFTISDAPPFHLKRLSQELVLPSHAYKDDAEVIQFWSGLELLNDTTLTLAYGINDCEGAATFLDLSTVENLLREIPQGKEVIDVMMPLKG
jgi:hypothetical protein